MPRIEQIDDDRPLRLDPGWHPNSESRPLTEKQRAMCEVYAEQYPHLFAVAYRLYPGECRLLIERGLTSDDIHSIAWLGVIRAAKRYKPVHGAKFSTYATYHVRAALSRQIADMGRKKRTLANEATILSPDEVSPDYGWDAIADARVQSIDRIVEAEHVESVRQRVGASIAMLHDRHRQVLQLRFGLTGEPPMTLTQAGKRIGISRNRIAQIEKDAMAKIRARAGNLLQAGAA